MFRKYEKTNRLIIPQINVHGKLYLSKAETQLLLGGKVAITEKLDGANVGIIRKKDWFRLQKRGSLVDTSEHEQYNFFKAWSNNNYEKLLKLPKNTIAYGELLRCVHTIYYDRLPDWVCIFAIWSDQHNEYLPWDEVKDICSNCGLNLVPELAVGHYSREDLFDLIPETSKYGPQKAEGIVVYNYRQQLRGKVVREEFIKDVEESDHWKYKEIKLNMIAGYGSSNREGS